MWKVRKFFYVAQKKIAFKSFWGVYFFFAVGNKMICNAPLPVIPQKIVCTDGKVFAVEKHPNKAVRFEFVTKFRV